MTNNWIDKYKPTTLDTVLGDRKKIDAIESFFKQFADGKINNPNLIISGPNGIGKTLIVDLILEKHKISKIQIDLSNLSVVRKKKKKKVNTEYFNQQHSVKTYYQTIVHKEIMVRENEYSTVIVFDDVGSISNFKEKEVIKALVKLNNKAKKIPIVIITNTKHNKIINELRKIIFTQNKEKCVNTKTTNEICLKYPEYDEIESLIKKIFQREKMKTEKSNQDEIYEKIICSSQYDIRRLLNILEGLKLQYGEEKITLPRLKNYFEIAKTKDIEFGIYESTRILLNDYTDVDTALNLYCEERAAIPLLSHENYPFNINRQYPHMPLHEKVNLTHKISKVISESDKIDGWIYSNQSWNLQPAHGFYSCVLPSYYINQYPGKLSNIEFSRYTKDYNRTSIKKINNKVIKKARENPHLKNFSIYDFLMISSILKSLIERDDLETIIYLIKPYHLSLKEIESIIKIDKIEKFKRKLSSKQKIYIQKSMQEDSS